MFIDFTKAFDYVVLGNVWNKLIKLGLIGDIGILNIVTSMYAYVTSRVNTVLHLVRNIHVNLWSAKENFYHCFDLNIFIHSYYTVHLYCIHTGNGFNRKLKP